MAAQLPEREPFDVAEFDRVVAVQDGVVSRQQILELKGTDADIARMLRRRELATIHPGVYVNHTGAPSRRQEEWAAVLAFWPAALSHASALPKPPRNGPVHVAVARDRRPRRVPGVVVHRIGDFSARAEMTKSPPRVSYEHAVIDVARGTPDVAEAFTVLADATQTRLTTAARIKIALAERPRVLGRRLLNELLDDLAQGACSVLERGYLELERRHGLPTEGNRQRPGAVGARRAYRDVDHSEYGWYVELDGRAFHDNASGRNQDAARDLAGAVTDEVPTVRLTYAQVFTDGCTTASAIGTLLERGGWAGPFTRCPGCPT